MARGILKRPGTPYKQFRHYADLRMYREAYAVFKSHPNLVNRIPLGEVAEHYAFILHKLGSVEGAEFRDSIKGALRELENTVNLTDQAITILRKLAHHNQR